MMRHTSVHARRVVFACASILVALAVWQAYLWYQRAPRGPERGIFREHIQPALQAQIGRRMEALRKSSRHPPEPASVARVQALWDRRAGTGVELRRLGIAAVVYIEPWTRTRGASKRLRAYEMLEALTLPGNADFTAPSPPRLVAQRRRYIGPLMMRGLKDTCDDIRLIAVSSVCRMYAPAPELVDILRPLLHDSDARVSCTAGRTLLWTYRRPDLVPGSLRARIGRRIE